MKCTTSITEHTATLLIIRELRVPHLITNNYSYLQQPSGVANVLMVSLLSTWHSGSAPPKEATAAQAMARGRPYYVLPIAAGTHLRLSRFLVSNWNRNRHKARSLTYMSFKVISDWSWKGYWMYQEKLMNYADGWENELKRNAYNLKRFSTLLSDTAGDFLFCVPWVIKKP